MELWDSDWLSTRLAIKKYWTIPSNCPLTHPNLTSKNWKKNRMRRTKKSDEMYNYVQLDPINKYKLYSKAYISSPQSVRFLPISLPSLLRHVGQFALGRPCEKFAQALLAVRNEVLGNHRWLRTNDDPCFFSWLVMAGNGQYWFNYH